MGTFEGSARGREIGSSWLDGYAVETALRKNCRQQDGSAPPQLRETIATAFKRVYRAVAFDIDGTLTVEDSPEIDQAAAMAIGELLRRGVHVFLVTGRGKSSTRSAALAIKEYAEVTEWYLRRLACVVLNGVALLTTNSETPSRFLEDEEPLAPKIQFIEPLLTDIKRALAIENDNIARVELKSNSLRIILNDNSFQSRAKNILDQSVVRFQKSGSPLYLSTGRYGSIQSFSIASTNKRIGLSAVAHKYGISPEHILRVGDQGHEGGNDFELLDSPAGFSVGTLSESEYGCLPVLDRQMGSIVRAAPATTRLTSILNLFPAISMSPRWTDKHTRTLLTFEKLALRRSREENETVTQRLRVRLRYLVGSSTNQGPTTQLLIDDIFDPLSGAIRFRDWEFSEIPRDHPAVKLFQVRLPEWTPNRKVPLLAWAMYSDTGILLRGPNYYFALSRPLEPPRLGDYLPEVNQLVGYAKQALEALVGAEPTLSFFKLVLAHADNVRNALIVLQYAAFVCDLAAADPTFQLARTLYQEMLLPHTRQHFNLLFNPDWPWKTVLKNYLTFITTLETALRAVNDKLLSSAQEMLAGEEIIRRWRESDNFIQNVTAVQLGLHEFQQRGDFSEGMTACGIVYGGTELPAIAQVVGEARRIPIRSLLVKLSLYRNRQAGKRVRSGDVAYVEEFVLKDNKICILGDSKPNVPATILLDDNITTGATLQLARDLLITNGADVAGAIAVGFPGSNRVEQMAMEGHGFVDPDVCVFRTFETCLGCFEATVYSLVHSKFGLAPAPDCTGTGPPGLPVFAPSSV